MQNKPETRIQDERLDYLHRLEPCATSTDALEAIAAEARANYEAGRSYSLDEAWRELGLTEADEADCATPGS